MAVSHGRLARMVLEEICKESNRLDPGRTEGRKVTRLKIDRIRYDGVGPASPDPRDRRI